MRINSIAFFCIINGVELVPMHRGSFHLSIQIIVVMSGKIGDPISYSGLFLIEILLCVATFIALFYLYPKKDCYDYSRTIT